MTNANETAAASGWNVFQHGAARDLWCAVPPNRPVPSFLLSGQWNFSRTDIRGNEVVPRFKDQVAEHAVDLKGFYLFQRFDEMSDGTGPCGIPPAP